jgi:osmotically-inducible protein OsmY
MKTIFVLAIGIALGAFGYYWYESQPSSRHFGTPSGAQISSSARDAADTAVSKTKSFASDVSGTLREKMRDWHLTSDDIHSDLAKTGEVVRENTARLREKVSDVRIVAVIKAKYVLDRDLSATSISVESTNGDVVLAGTVAAENLVGKAVALALDTEGVHHVKARLTTVAK